jgi:hypothetical protein
MIILATIPVIHTFLSLHLDDLLGLLRTFTGAFVNHQFEHQGFRGRVYVLSLEESRVASEATNVT